MSSGAVRLCPIWSSPHDIRAFPAPSMTSPDSPPTDPRPPGLLATLRLPLVVWGLLVAALAGGRPSTRGAE